VIEYQVERFGDQRLEPRGGYSFAVKIRLANGEVLDERIRVPDRTANGGVEPADIETAIMALIRDHVSSVTMDLGRGAGREAFSSLVHPAKAKFAADILFWLAVLGAGAVGLTIYWWTHR
jgi:hypothetical protein